MPGQSLPAQPVAAPRGEDYNPFFEISQTFRTMFVVYFVFWQIVPAIVLALRSEATTTAVLGLNLVLELVVIGFAMLPFMVRSFGGVPMGWLNPLALASVLVIVRTLIQRPIHAIEPYVIWFREPARIDHELLVYWSLDAVQWVQVKGAAMVAIALIAYHAGFYLFQLREKSKRPIVRTAPTVYFVVLYAIMVLAFVLLIALSGNLASHFAALARGRFAVRENTGVLLVVIGFMPYLLVIWYLLRPAILRMPLFWAMLLFALFLQFASDGSRTAVLIPLVIFTAAWIYHNRRIPVVAGLIGMGLAILLLAVLGSIRTEARQQGAQPDDGSLISFDVTDTLERNEAEIAKRSWRSSGVAIAALVPRENDYLYGESYVAAVMFWVPRSIWNEKPRGAGALVNAILFLKRESADGFNGAGYPTGGAAEAFWNFGWVGILVVFPLFGAFHKYVAIRVMQRPEDVKAVTLMLLAVISLGDASTDQLVPFMQLFVLLHLTFVGLKLFGSENRNKRPAGSAALPHRT